MTTARKQSFNDRSMSRQSRNKSYAAINILWKKMRPDLVGEDKEVNRDERLNWISNFLNLDGLDSTTSLSDMQIGLLLDEMKRMTGEKQFSNPQLAVSGRRVKPIANVVHLTANRISDEQKYTLRKLAQYIGWSSDRRNDWLTARNYPTNISSMTFKKATALTMIFLNIAAQKDLKADGKPTGRKELAKYIPILKKKLGIDQGR